MPGVVVDTNVPIVANKNAPQASLECVRQCQLKFGEILQYQEKLVLDEDGEILQEYKRHLRSSGQPGIGDAFLKWVLLNEWNPRFCVRVAIHPAEEGNCQERVSACHMFFDREQTQFGGRSVFCF